MSDPQTLRPDRMTRRRLRIHCRRSQAGPAVHIAIRGELDISTLPDLDRAITRAWATTHVIVLDLRELEFLDSSGAQLLLEADRRIRRSGGRLVVVRGSDEVDWLLGLLGLNTVLELVDHPPELRYAPARTDSREDDVTGLPAARSA